MHTSLEHLIINTTGAETVTRSKRLQRLWSGYGEIVRYGLTGCDRDSVIVKHVKLALGREGVNNDFAHKRKTRSYQVETNWYRRWSQLCDVNCRVPACLAIDACHDEIVMILEDLDAAGFPQRRSNVNPDVMRSCLNWLANFHATFFGMQPENLWPIGTYWYLETRPAEWQALTDPVLKNAAASIDRQLRDSPYQTLVHGDAKLDNFCFSTDGRNVAAVDFQYVGGGCGIKDVAYFIDSCLDNQASERHEKRLLDDYFHSLKQAFKRKQGNVDAEAVEENWRSLYPVAWTDFHRFLKGWSPKQWHPDSYSERLARQVINTLSDPHGGSDESDGA